MASRELLTLAILKTAAKDFVAGLTNVPIRELYGVDNGKTIGIYVEHAKGVENILV